MLTGRFKLKYLRNKTISTAKVKLQDYAYTTAQFQPIFCLPAFGEGQPTLIGVEALAREIRVNKEKVDLLPPQNIIELFNAQNDIPTLDFNTLEATCHLLAGLQYNGVPLPHEFKVNVNFSAQTLALKDFSTGVSQILTNYGIEPCHIGIEIIEDSFQQHDQNEILSNIQKRASLGHRIAIDDFGAGASDINRVKLLSALQLKEKFTLKIDGELTQQIESVRNINSLPLKCLENNDLIFERASKNFHLLLPSIRNAGFHGRIMVQSYDFGKPMDGTKITALIKNSYEPQKIHPVSPQNELAA